MIRRIIRAFCFLVLTSCLVSCFEIKETIHIHEDGSGTYALLMDLSQIKPLFTMSRNFQRSMNDSTSRVKNTNPAPNPMLQMKAKFDALQPALESVGGISEYKTVCDTSAYIIGATYSFATVESLNKSINVLRSSNATGSGGTPSAAEVPHYSFSQKRFEKFNDISKSDIGGATSKNDSLTTELFKGARYTLTCTFDRKIKEVSNPIYFISADGKTLLYTGSLLDIMNQKTTVGNTVLLY